MMNKKIVLTSVIVGVVGIGSIFTLSSFGKEDNVKAQVTPQTEIKVKKETSNLALETALNDFTSLDEFNKKFFDTHDEAWMVPDVSSEGSMDGGESHGWTTSPTKELATDSNIVDNNTGKVVDTMKASDGATAGEIRKALAERDNAN